NGPSLIEAVTYRQNAHSAFDIKKDYFSAEDYKIEQEWLKKDPIDRIREYLKSIKLWDDNKQAELDKQITKKVNDAITWALKNESVSIDEIFDYTYEKLTPQLIEQKAEAKVFFNEGEKK
ncbi:MAG: pyruvate dehydrogenase (acetyl-transferring) E1 component subunit alpha, partial [Spiroplasma sp. WSS]